MWVAEDVVARAVARVVAVVGQDVVVATAAVAEKKELKENEEDAVKLNI